MNVTPETKPEVPGGQLLVHTIEDKARWFPDNMYMRYAPRDWVQNGYQTITWKQYANAIDKVAFWLSEQLGKATDRDTVAYSGPNDPRYAVLLPAVMKNELKVGTCHYVC